MSGRRRVTYLEIGNSMVRNLVYRTPWPPQCGEIPMTPRQQQAFYLTALERKSVSAIEVPLKAKGIDWLWTHNGDKIRFWRLGGRYE